MAKRKSKSEIEQTAYGKIVKLPEDEQKNKVSDYFRRFRAAEYGVSGKHKKWSEIDAFDRGEQWKNSSMPPWVAKPVNNMIRYFRTLKRANLASAIPKAHFYPIRQEFEEQVNQLKQAYDHVWEAKKVPRVIRFCVDRAIAQGTAIAYVYNDQDYIGGVYFDKNDPRNNLYQGELNVKWWPNTNFFIDPDAFRLKEAKYIETTQLLPLSLIKRNKAFIQYAGKDKLDGMKGDQVDRENSADGSIYERDTNPSDGHFGRIEGDEMATLHCHWERYLNEDGKWQLDCTYYTKNNNFILYRLEDIKPNDYPFAVLYFEEEEQDFWGSGQSEDVLDNQKVVNKADQVAAIIGTLHQNPQKIVARESGINAQELAKFGTLPGKVWVTNTRPSESVHQMETKDIPKGLFDLSDRMKADMRETVGVNEAYTGSSVGSLTTSTGVNSLIERATVRDKDKMIQIDDFVEDLSDLIVKFILHTWKDKRPIMTMQPNGKPSYGNYEPIDDLTAENLEWRVRSDVYATAPVTQALKRQQADQIMQMQGQFQFNPPMIVPEEWIKMQDFEHGDEILQRMEKDRQILEQQKAQDMAKLIQQVAKQVADARAKGEAEPMVQQIAIQAAQQLLGQKQQQDAKNGMMNMLPQQSQAPQGTTGQLAMSNMARGM